MITRVYGGRNISRFLNRFGLDGATVDNMQLLASHGYAVFMPNVPMGTGMPLREVGDAVLPGVDRVIEMGIADSEALGLMGHSYGGCCVNCLITQTTRFRAAVSSAGIKIRK